MKDYQLKKDSNGWQVWSFGKHLGRFYRIKEGYRVALVNKTFKTKDDAVQHIVSMKN